MNSPQVKQDMTVEMASVTNRIAAVRAHVHHAIKQELSPKVRQFLHTKHPLEAVSSTSNFLPTIQSVAELLKVYPVPSALHASSACCTFNKAKPKLVTSHISANSGMLAG